jgi:hypothetical protein
MLRQLDKAFHYSEGITAAPTSSVAVTAPRVKGELREQIFMDVIAAHRNVLRFAFVGLGAAFCVRTFLG